MRAALLTAGWLTASGKAGQFADAARLNAEDWRHDEITLLTAYHQGRFGFAETGIGRSIHGVAHHPSASAITLAPNCARITLLVSWKVGGYFTAGIAMGFHAIRYQERAIGCTVLRPEIGIGVLKAKLTYAGDVSLSSRRIDGISTHLVSIAYALRLARPSGDAQS